MTTEQKCDRYDFSRSLSDRFTQQRKEKKDRRKKITTPLKGFIEITTILAIVYVIGRFGSYEWDKISTVQFIVGSLVAVIYIVIAVLIHWLLDKQGNGN